MKLMILIMGLSVWVGLALAQNYVFGPNVRVNSDAPGTSAHWTASPGQHLIAARGDTVYSVWTSDRGGEQHVYSGRSVDGGRSFLPSVRVDNTPSGCEGSEPGLAVDDSGGIHVSWLNRNPTNGAFVYYAKSTNGGQSFLPPVRACDSLYRSQYATASIAVSRDGRRVYVARSERHDPGTLPYTVYLSRSTNGGATFIAPDSRADTSDTLRAMYDPSVAVFNDTIVMVLWDAGRVCFSRSTNAGAGFEPSLALSDSGPGSANASLGVDSEGRAYGVWGGVSIAVSQDTGRSFSQARRIPGATGLRPSLHVASDGRLFLGCELWNAEDGELVGVRLIFSADHGDSFSTPVNPSDGPWNSEELEATVTVSHTGDVFMAWTDDRNDTLGFNSDIYCATGVFAAIEEAKPVAGTSLRCEASPNPTRGSTCIKYWLPSSGYARVVVYDATGRRVRVFQNGVSLAGLHAVLWRGTGASRPSVKPGVYLLRIETPSGATGCKIQLVGE